LDSQLNARENQALDIIDRYEGANNFILKLKHKRDSNPKFFPNATQTEYVIKYHKREPKVAKKWVQLDTYFASKIANEKMFIEVPTQIWIEKLLVEKDTAYHVWGYYFENQGLHDIWIPKAAVIKDNKIKNVEIDFEKYSHRPLLEHQKEGVKTLCENKKYILADDLGLGKALSNQTLIYTPNGTKKMGDIMIGDKVIGSNGKPVNVIGVFPQGIRETYKVTFNDGFFIFTDESHLWSVSSSNHGKNSNNNRLKKTLTLSTKQMYKNHIIQDQGRGYNNFRTYSINTHYRGSNGANKWQIPIVEPIEFENNEELPIDPYLLGLILGDGHIQSISCRFETHRDDFDELFGDFKIKENKQYDNKRTCSISIGEPLKNLSLSHTRSHNKFIPDIYKYTSVNNRLAILQGLMDTDGHCMLSKNGNFCGTEFSTVSEKLCDDLCEIVHTLGGIVRKRKRKSFYKKNGERIECRPSYRLNIKLPKGMNPFRLKRKSDRYNEPQKYQTGRYISKIEKQGEYECTCISVDSVDNLYVAEHCIVTHNTTTAVVASIESNANKVLVICPASLKINWKRELENYTDRTISIVEGKKWEDADYVIINYDILKNFHTLEKDSESIIRDAKFDLVIVDEAHAICNVQAQRTKLVNDISKISQRTWLLTGTPVTSRPINYFNLLNLVDCNVAQNWMAYVKRYCNGYQFRAGNRKIWNVSGASNLEELYERTKPFVLRRLKNDVLDLPEKIISPIYMRLKSREYEEVMGEYYEWYDKGGESNSLTMQFSKIAKVRQIIANEKVSQTIELCENILDQDKKVIIFCNFTESLNTIYSHFKKIAVKLDGSTPKGERQDAVDKFQTDEKVKVFVGNIKAAGVGLTLTAAETVIMNDLSFLPSDHSQAEDRAYRYGQKNNVVVYYPIFENTIEGIIYDILDKKKRIINTVMGDTMLFEGDALENILQSINQNRN
jgi:hypothetical protein